MDYQNVIIAAGYEIEQLPMKAKYIKEQYLRALISGVETDSIIKSVFQEMDLNYNSNYTCLVDLNNYLLNFIQNTGYPLQNIINLFIEKIISTYESTEKES